MSNYTKTTNFTAKDALPTGDSGKIIRGTEFDVEFNAIASAISSKADTASPSISSPDLTGTPTADTATAGTNTRQIASTAFVTTAVTNERTATATLTNKTLTSPTANDATLSGTTSIGNGATLTTPTITTPTFSLASNLAFELDKSTALNSLYSVGYFAFTDASTSNVAGVLGRSDSSTGVAGATYSSQPAGAFYNATSDSYSSFNTTAYLAGEGAAAAGQFNYFGSSTSPTNITVEIAGDAFGIDLNGSASVSFTGAHSGLINKTETQPTVGDILVDVSVYAKPGISETLCVNSLSTSANQKGAVGVFASYTGSDYIPSAIGTKVEINNMMKTVIDPAYTDIDDYNKVFFNAIGEGLINVCGEGGNIEVGDLIVTSSIVGKGMKQADDVIRGYTVAKAREAVTFASATEVKQIACIYLAG